MQMSNMEFKLKENRLCLYMDLIEVGFIEYEKNNQDVEIIQTYIYPGLRNNNYGRYLVEYANEKYNYLIKSSKCDFYNKITND